MVRAEPFPAWTGLQWCVCYDNCTRSRPPEIWHVYITTWKAAQLKASGVGGNCKSETLKGRNGASSRALTNQTLVAESLNITTSKISAAMWLACTAVKRFNTAQLSLTNYVPATTNHRKHGCNWIFLAAWRDFSDKLNFCLMDQDSVETDFFLNILTCILPKRKERNVSRLLDRITCENKGPFIKERKRGHYSHEQKLKSFFSLFVFVPKKMMWC